MALRRAISRNGAQQSDGRGQQHGANAAVGQIDAIAGKGGADDQQQTGQDTGVVADDGFHFTSNGYFFDGQVDAPGNDDAADGQRHDSEDDAAGGHLMADRQGHDAHHYALKGQHLDEPGKPARSE